MVETISKTTKVIEDCAPDNIPDEVYTSAEPIILKGAVKNWPLVKAGLDSPQAAIALLRIHYSGKPAPIYYAEPGTRRFSYNADISKLNFDIRRADINQVLDEIEANIKEPNPPIRYIASNVIETFFPTLKDENDLAFNAKHFIHNPLEFADPLRGIWIGNRTLSPCHWDAQSNIACVVAGKRKFTLFPPDQIHNLYPGPLDLNPGGPAITLVDFDSPDFGKFPRYKNAIATGQIAELEPGDALFIPCMWWHQVEALSPFNILINYWWNTFPKIRGPAMHSLRLALLSIRDRPAQEKEAWKNLFDYYIFGDKDNAGAHLPEAARGVLGEIDEDLARQMRAELLQKLNR